MRLPASLTHSPNFERGAPPMILGRKTRISMFSLPNDRFLVFSPFHRVAHEWIEVVL